MPRAKTPSRNAKKVAAKSWIGRDPPMLWGPKARTAIRQLAANINNVQIDIAVFPST
jgi:hypothetical protein